ncbi:hypothetical protein GOV14_06635 [Candidatus Pacearchaeota archaeon]|nr:hypothetical protein [Candidatus Pacearchaeota archaeon]
MAKFDFNPSATIELSGKHINRYNSILPSNLVVQIDSEGASSHSYYMMSLDPSLEKVKLSLPKIKLQRILYPLVANVFAVGNTNLIPWTLFLINYLSIVISTYLVILLLKKYNANLNLAYLWAFNVGYLITAIRDLPSPLMFLFVISSVFYLDRKRIYLATLFFSLALLTKESSTFVILPILLYFLFKKEIKSVAILSLSFLPFLVWSVYVSSLIGDIVLVKNYSNVTVPFMGFIKYLVFFNFEQPVKDIFWNLLPLPVMIFTFIQFFDIKKYAFYGYNLFFQIFFQFIFPLLPYRTIDIIGRHAMPVYLFSILYYAESNRKYNYLLAIITILLSVGYFILKIIIFDVNYYIT